MATPSFSELMSSRNITFFIVVKNTRISIFVSKEQYNDSADKYWGQDHQSKNSSKYANWALDAVYITFGNKKIPFHNSIIEAVDQSIILSAASIFTKSVSSINFISFFNALFVPNVPLNSRSFLFFHVAGILK